MKKSDSKQLPLATASILGQPPSGGRFVKIQSIEITNYKAFLGPYKIKVGGKNLFIYGENGSGNKRNPRNIPKLGSKPI